MTRDELFVFLAMAVGWLTMAAWAFRIARKINRLSRGERPD